MDSGQQLLDPLIRRRTPDECLIRRQRAGDTRARDELIERYLPLARSVALRYRRTVEPTDDLFQVACVGLVKAVDRWDPDRGYAFSSFAVPTIRGELRRHFRDLTWDVRPPRRLQELCVSIDAARHELGGQLGREPKVIDLARRLERTAEEVVEALEASDGRHVRSLDVVVADDEGSATAGELIGRDDEAYARVEATVTIERLTPGLDRRAREVLRLRFEEGLMQSEIGRRVGCTQMHVSRILRASLKQLSADAGVSLAA
jgi:RNA polymerase sigma-B factor